MHHETSMGQCRTEVRRRIVEKVKKPGISFHFPFFGDNLRSHRKEGIFRQDTVLRYSYRVKALTLYSTSIPVVSQIFGGALPPPSTLPASIWQVYSPDLLTFLELGWTEEFVTFVPNWNALSCRQYLMSGHISHQVPLHAPVLWTLFVYLNECYSKTVLHTTDNTGSLQNLSAVRWRAHPKPTSWRLGTCPPSYRWDNWDSWAVPSILQLRRLGVSGFALNPTAESTESPLLCLPSYSWEDWDSWAAPSILQTRRLGVFCFAFHLSAEKTWTLGLCPH